MRKGAIPVPHIIALVLGIIVVGLLAFWFFILGGRLPGETDQARCNTLIHQYCTAWSACGYDAACAPSLDETAWNAYAPACNAINTPIPTSYSCKLVMGLLPNGSPCTTAAQCAGGDCNDDGECATA